MIRLQVKFRTVRLAALVLLAAVLVVPAAIIVGYALYYRSGAYVRRIAQDLSEGLGTRVFIGRVERHGRGSFTLHEVAIGGTAETPLIAAQEGYVSLDDLGGRTEVGLAQARLVVRSRRAFEELLAWPSTRVRESGVRLLLSDASFAWEVNDAIQGRAAVGLLESGGGAPEKRQEGPRGHLRVRRSKERECAVTWEPTADGGETVVLEQVPLEVLHLAGVAPNMPLGAARADGRLFFSREGFGSPKPAFRVELRIANLPAGTLTDRWGLSGISCVCDVTFEGRYATDLAVTKMQVSGGHGGACQVTGQVLRRLSYLVSVDPPDLPDTTGELRLTAFDFTVRTEETDRVVLAGGLEPAGTVMQGMLDGDTAPRALLRLNRTNFTMAELAERLAEVRAGKADEPKKPTTTQAASRPAG